MSSDILTSPEIVQEFIQVTREKHEHPELYRGWNFGIEALDNITGGIGRNWYVIVAGQRKAGKTSMLTTITKSLGRQGVGFLRVSLEENNLQVAERLFSHIGNIDRTRFRDVVLAPEDFNTIDNVGVEIAQYQGVFGYGMSTIAEITKLVDALNPQVLLLDYVQLMMHPGAQTRTMEVSMISRELKKLTLRNPQMAVVAAAQLNDEGEYLWSRDLGRDADLAIKLTRINDPYGQPIDHKLKLEVADSRHSETGDFEVAFNGARSLVGTLVHIPLGDILT